MDSYFTTEDDVWFQPTPFTRGPWNRDACHAGPPTAMMVRALERIVAAQRLAHISVDLERPIPMAGFRVEAEILRGGRSVTRAMARIVDDATVYATARSLHVRQLETIEVDTAQVNVPDFEMSVPGSFPIVDTLHGEQAFPSSLQARYGSGDGYDGRGSGGPTIMWMRTIPMLPDEEPTGVQKLCPLADSGNGISYNGYLDRTLFINPDLHMSVFAEPVGDWFCTQVRSHWMPDGTGMSEATLFDRTSMVGRASQNLLLTPVT